MASTAPMPRPRERPPASHQVFCGGLEWTVTTPQLIRFFRDNGHPPVDAFVAVDTNGHSRLWGLATFATPEAARQAREELDGWAIDGRAVRLYPAREKSNP